MSEANLKIKRSDASSTNLMQPCGFAAPETVAGSVCPTQLPDGQHFVATSAGTVATPVISQAVEVQQHRPVRVPIQQNAKRLSAGDFRKQLAEPPSQPAHGLKRAEEQYKRFMFGE